MVYVFLTQTEHALSTRREMLWSLLDNMTPSCLKAEPGEVKMQFLPVYTAFPTSWLSQGIIMQASIESYLSQCSLEIKREGVPLCFFSSCFKKLRRRLQSSWKLRWAEQAHIESGGVEAVTAAVSAACPTF